MEPPDPVDARQRWSDLLAHHDVASMAATVAWEALVAAYKPSLEGTGTPSRALLDQYRAASALKAAAEQLLVDYLKERHRLMAGPGH